MKIKLITTSIAAVLLLNACALGPSTKGDYSKADPSITKEEVNFFSSSGYMACAAGGAVGALGGVLACLGKDPSTMVACGAAGAIAGCAVFMGGNYYLNSLRSEYKLVEDRINAVTKDIEEDNKRLSALNTQTTELIKQDKNYLANLNKTIKNKEELKKAKEDKLVQINANIAYLTDTSEAYAKKLSSFDEVRKGIVLDDKGNNIKLSADDKKQLALLDKRLKQLKQEKADLEKNISEFTAMSNVVSESMA